MELRDHAPPASPPANEIGVLHQLECYLGLGQQCRQWGTILEKAESHRHNVRASIFEKVRKEYQDKKAVLEMEWTELGNALRKNLQQILAERLSIQEEAGMEMERLEEMDFRILAGEFQEGELAGEMGSVRQRRDERARDLERIDGILRLYADTGLFPEASALRTREEDGGHGLAPDAAEGPPNTPRQSARGEAANPLRPGTSRPDSGSNPRRESKSRISNFPMGM